MDGGGETTLVFAVAKSEIQEISKIPENFLERLLKVTVEVVDE